MTTVRATRRQLGDAISVLYGWLSDRHGERLDELLLDAGLLIRCPACRWQVVTGDGQPRACPACAAPPAGD